MTASVAQENERKGMSRPTTKYQRNHVSTRRKKGFIERHPFRDGRNDQEPKHQRNVHLVEKPGSRRYMLLIETSFPFFSDDTAFLSLLQVVYSKLFAARSFLCLSNSS